jgi:streptomycin 6-kinase
MNEFEKNIINLYGEEGKKWLNNLPKLTAQMASKQGLSDLKPVKNLSYNYVLSGHQNSKPIILKLHLKLLQGLVRLMY